MAYHYTRAKARSDLESDEVRQRDFAPIAKTSTTSTISVGLNDDNIKTWTGLSVEESIRMTEDRDKWRKYVHRVANPRIEDG